MKAACVALRVVVGSLNVLERERRACRMAIVGPLEGTIILHNKLVCFLMSVEVR